MEDRVKDVKELNLEKDELPMERALGVGWCIESDKFKQIGRASCRERV